MKKRILIGGCLSLVVAVVCLVAWAAWSVYDSEKHPRYGEGVEHVSWLPAEARNISYYKRYSWEAFEFDIPEQAFLRWARRWDLKPIDSPVTIPTYRYLLSPDRPAITVSQGLCFSERWSNGGGVQVVYDSSKGRAYFQSNPR